jgi:hypothetical protein
MPERILLGDVCDWTNFFLVSAVTKNETIDQITANSKNDGLGLEVSLTINGVECEVSSTLKKLEEMYYSAVKEAAGKLLNDALSDFTVPIYNLLRDVEKGFKKKLEELGIETTKEEDY